jgi:hypothetical protein
VDPTGGGGSNISLNVKESTSQGQGSMENSSISLDQTTINQIVNGLQQASSSGATQLHSRDIPITTDSVMNDPYVQQNYIPPPRPTVIKDYIKEYSDTNKMIENHNTRSKQVNQLDQLYDEIQIPLMIAILYFLFQLPAFRKIIFKYFPVLFFKDGNLNLYGYLFTSSLFGILYYLISKMAIHLT